METTDREALNDIDSRINAIERRLRNAKMARDAYIDFLRGKYPNWRGISLPTYQKVMFTENRRDFLVNDLATADYHWDIGRENLNSRIPISSGKLHNQIPQRGPLLQSDVVLMRHRLQEISNQLRVMREHRIHMATQEYTKMRDTTDVFGPGELHLNEESDEITELRRRIEGIDVNEPQRIRSPTKIDLQRAEEEVRQNALIREIRENPPRAFFDEPSTQIQQQLIIPLAVQPAKILEEPSRSSTTNQASGIRSLSLSQPQTQNVPENVPKSTVTFKAEEPKPVEKSQPRQDVPQSSQSNDLSKVMSMFGNQTTTDTESDETPVPVRRNQPSQISSILPSFSNQPPKVDILSQYMGKSKPQDPLQKLLQMGKGDDSDDDFFK
ncbi:unnamed protein product, partial [Mesorhabditis belari]|uniref:Uncharacterized protein n=1 Tax=Mesorhabditis belari TaxID=2138241 RepID=A0AAF3FQ05_9BILA